MEDILAPVLVEKEEIANMTFNKPADIYPQADLTRKISDAMLLGNSYHTKVSIVFFDDEGLKRVNTTIWASGNKYLCLKGGLWLPVDHVVDIELI
ncbi:MAG: hypothetical protein N4A41_02790 [Crocinitomicaceae bacterium]|jgi:hypothetical protein|nr:hypothetical protein [Crocinitomicaceae bacterium]